MAFVDTRLHELVWSPGFATRIPAPTGPLLERVERDVLLASRRDRVSSLGSKTLFSRWSTRLFGVRTSNRLADPRLEALRRFAVLLRNRGESLPSAEQRRIVLAGFSPVQVAEVRRLIEAERSPHRMRWKRGYLTLIALAFAVEAVVFRLASAYFSDGMVGFVFALTTAVAGTPLLRPFRRGTAPAFR
jgi:hypothetical protein